MRCVATLGSGGPCGREVQSELQLCSYHQKVELWRRGRTFYRERLSPEDQEALAMAAQLEGVDAEIAILRVLIRRMVNAGDVEAARRGIDTLCRMLRARHELDERSTDQLVGSLERVLDTLGEELGVPL